MVFGHLSPKGKKVVSRKARCDLIFPVACMHRFLKRGLFSRTVGIGGGIFMAAVLEYLAKEILELAGNACREKGKKTISPRHLMLAMKNDEELNKLVAHTTISTGGVLPNIQGFLFGKKNPKAVTHPQAE